MSENIKQASYVLDLIDHGMKYTDDVVILIRLLVRVTEHYEEIQDTQS